MGAADCAATETRAAADGGYGGGGRRSRHGKVFDVMGDVATNDGDSGHQTRHFLILNALYDALRVYGGQVRREAANYSEYSDHRPDLTLLLEGELIVFDLKVFAPIGSDAGEVELRGGSVGFGNTAPRGQLVVHGRRERLGPPATFVSKTGAGRSLRTASWRRELSARRSRCAEGRATSTPS